MRTFTRFIVKFEIDFQAYMYTGASPPQNGNEKLDQN